MCKKQLFSAKAFCLLLLWICCASNSSAGEAMSDEPLDDWFKRDDSTSTEMVSEGKLRFLPKQSGKPVLHSLNRLIVYEDSLDDGWIALSQCYQNLDPVAKSEVVYHYKSMQELKITSYKNIEVARIQGQSVQLINVQREAELCITARVRIFYQNQDGSYSLINGPFHRKFLDGYYPYHLTMEVFYPESRLEILRTLPVEQPGFSIHKQKGKLLLDGIFEGILNVEIVFLAR